MVHVYQAVKFRDLQESIFKCIISLVHALHLSLKWYFALCNDVCKEYLSIF